MWELVQAGGWMMLPIILSSIAATAIVAERLWTLRKSRVAPPELLGQVWKQIKGKQLSAQKLKDLRANSPLGEILAAGLANSKHGREIMKECIEEAASGVIHELERYLNALGTIAAMAPLLGLLGTVFGMIQIFGAFMDNGMANSPMLAAGISKALITTAAAGWHGMSWWSAARCCPSAWTVRTAAATCRSCSATVPAQWWSAPARASTTACWTCAWAPTATTSTC